MEPARDQGALRYFFVASGVVKQEEALAARMKNLEERDGVLQLLHQELRISAVMPGR